MSKKTPRGHKAEATPPDKPPEKPPEPGPAASADDPLALAELFHGGGEPWLPLLKPASWPPR